MRHLLTEIVVTVICGAAGGLIGFAMSCVIECLYDVRLKKQLQEQEALIRVEYEKALRMLASCISAYQATAPPDQEPLSYEWWAGLLEFTRKKLNPPMPPHVM